MLRVSARHPYAVGRKIHVAALHRVHVVQALEAGFVGRHDDARNAVGAVGQLEPLGALHDHSRIAALGFKRLRHRVGPAVDAVVDVGDGIEAVHAVVMHVVAVQHVVVQRDGRDHEGRAPGHAHDGAEHAPLVVHAVVHDGLGVQGQLLPDSPSLVEPRLARWRLLAPQQLDGMPFQDGAAGKPSRPQDQHELDRHGEKRQLYVEVRGKRRQGEARRERAGDDGLDHEHAHDQADDGAQDHRERRVQHEARSYLAVAQPQRLLRADLRDLLAHDAPHGRIAHEQPHDDEQRRHREAQARGDVRQRGHLDRPAVVSAPEHRPLVPLQRRHLLLGSLELGLLVGNLLLGVADLHLGVFELGLPFGEFLLSFGLLGLELLQAGMVLHPSGLELRRLLRELGLSLLELGPARSQLLASLRDGHRLAVVFDRHVLDEVDELPYRLLRVFVGGVVDRGHRLADPLRQRLELLLLRGAVLVEVLVVLLLGDLLRRECLVLLFQVVQHVFGNAQGHRLQLVERVDHRLGLLQLGFRGLDLLGSLRLFGFARLQGLVSFRELGLGLRDERVELIAPLGEFFLATGYLLLALVDLRLRVFQLGFAFIEFLLGLVVQAIVTGRRERFPQLFDPGIHDRGRLLVFRRERAQAAHPVVAHVHQRVAILVG